MQLKWRLSHARGYLGLGMIAEAEAELDRLHGADADELDTLALRVAILQEQHRWPELSRIAQQLVGRQPGDAGWWITFAYATRRADSLQRAEQILLEAEKLHPDNATIQFNLGCYLCVRGELAPAKIHVARAIELEPRFRAAVPHDADLAAIRSDYV